MEDKSLRELYDDPVTYNAALLYVGFT